MALVLTPDATPRMVAGAATLGLGVVLVFGGMSLEMAVGLLALTAGVMLLWPTRR